MKLGRINRKWANIGLHVTFWMLVFWVPYVLIPSLQGPQLPGRITPSANTFIYINSAKCVFWIFIFYFNAYFLVPTLVYTKKYVRYALSLISVLVALSLLEYILLLFLDQTIRFRIGSFLMFNLFPYLFIVASGTAYRVVRDKTSGEKRIKDREAEHLKSELSFLRSQVSPHFMFNVINNIVSLARKKSDEVEPSLIKLSSLMRYFLYESNNDKVPLEKEVEYLRSYIDLQQQRFGKNVKVQWQSKQIDFGYEIEPMLLIPFVENAFKHGIVQNGIIDISLNAQNGVLKFKVMNHCQSLNVNKDHTSGIGLANVERRLRLLYPFTHSLLICRQEESFTISLEIKLH